MKTQVFAVALAATALAGSSDAVRAKSRGSAEVIIAVESDAAGYDSTPRA